MRELAALLLVRPKGNLLGETLRLLPDLLRLLPRLAIDADVPRAARVRLSLLLAYLAIPFDVVPDFVPVRGYADAAPALRWCDAIGPEPTTRSRHSLA